ncbi:hypothetical protein [Bacillus salipaludis]|uniref:Uncharacterized protein n=1 Tax=Bacillus salipaludis TaxID=2547811 RepID=A0ABW8RBF1_9BACI
MKLLVFFALIGLSLSGSLVMIQLINNKKRGTVMFYTIFFNLVILGLGSLWWFWTETDGISQGIRVMIYFGSFIGISLLDLIVIFVRDSFQKSGHF